MSANHFALTPDDYVRLLVERSWELHREHNAARADVGLPPLPDHHRPLPEQMIREGDDLMVDVAAIITETSRLLRAEQKRKRRQPRRLATVRSVNHWRTELARIDAALQVESNRSRLGTTDIAAYAGIGVRRTPRQQRRDGAAMDRSIERTARLLARRSLVAARLARAEAEAGA